MTSVPDSPYKGLAAFQDSELDALFFFGRGREISAVAANVLASRLTVLYGPSGVGKSSLLRAGVARRLRELSGAPVVVHDSWAEDPVAGLIASVRAECGGLGATAGLVDTIAAAALESGELHLLLDQFEDYMLYHGTEGSLNNALPELLRRPGLRVNILLALRDDTLAELDEFSGRIPELFGNLLRLDRLDREEGRAAIVGPLERYSGLSGQRFTAEDELVEAVLDEVSERRLELGPPQETPGARAGIEAPYLQLVLERLWERERADGSTQLRLATFRAIGGAGAVVREHVQGALERLSLPEQEAAARVVRQLVTPSGRKVSHEAADLAEYADVDDDQLRGLLETLSRERIVRGVNGTPGAPTRYEIFHDVLGPPILAWQTEHQLRSERIRARRQRRRLRAIVAASLAALIVVGGLATYAFLQRSDARTQTQHAEGREAAARALAELPTNPQVGVQLALRAARLAPGAQTASVLRSSLLAMRETRILRLGGHIVAATFAPQGDRLLAASSNGRVAVYTAAGHKLMELPRQPALTMAVWSPDGRFFATGATDGMAKVWRVGDPEPIINVLNHSPITALDIERKTLLVGSGTHVSLLVGLAAGMNRTIPVGAGVLAAALDPNGSVFAVSTRHGKGTRTSIVDVHTGRTLAVLPEDGIHSFAFSPDGRLLATGSTDKTARIWDARTGRQLHVLRHHGYVLSEQFSRDGRSLVTASSDGAGYVWDVANGQRELLLVGATGAATDAAFSPDGSEIAVASADRLARIYYSQDGRLLAPLAGHGDAVTSVEFDPSGQSVATGSADGTVRLWNALPAGTLQTIYHSRDTVDTLFAGAHPVAVSGRQARILTTSGRRVAGMRATAPIFAAAAHDDDVAVTDRRGTLYLLTAGGALSRVKGKDITAVAFASDGTLLTGSRNGTVSGWSTTGGVLRPNLPPLSVHRPVLGLSAGGGRVLVHLSDELRVYTDDGKLVSTIHTAARHATLSPGGQGVATTKGKDAQLWDASTGRLLHTLSGHSSLVTDAEFSPNGLQLVTVSDDHRGIVWSARSGRLLRVLVGHFFPVQTGSYSPDGHWIVTASQFTAGLWNAGTGQLVLYLGRHAAPAPLTGAVFNPSGDWILTGGNDGTARVYHCQICEPLPQLEQLAEARLRALH